MATWFSPAPSPVLILQNYRTSILPFSALLLIATVLLIAGDWHFVSDVIAGTFVGV